MYYGQFESETIEEVYGDNSSVDFSSEQCEYIATRADNLRKHIEAKHLGVTYACELCPYQATQKQNLKRHCKLKHSSE